MQASVLVAPKRHQLTEVAMPPMGPNDVLVRVKACGVCRSELDDWQAPPVVEHRLRIMGHEPSGVIEDVGAAVTALCKGQPVTVFTGGAGRYTDYTSGGYAEYVAVPQENVVVLPPGLPFEQALGEPLACLVSAFERTPIALADRVAVIGCGFMGLALLQLLKLKSPHEIVAVDVDPAALELARRFGADRVCTPDQLEPVRWWTDETNGFDVVVEASGAAKALTLAGEIARAHATLSVVGYHPGLRQVDVGLWNIKALTVINAHEKRRAYFMQCMRNGIDLIARGKLDMKGLVSHTYRLGELDGAFDDLLRKVPTHTKGVVLM
jgi:threonine dehydrogenase-like Zn-dependent dehydrogenase